MGNRTIRRFVKHTVLRRRYSSPYPGRESEPHTITRDENPSWQFLDGRDFGSDTLRPVFATEAGMIGTRFGIPRGNPDIGIRLYLLPDRNPHDSQFYAGLTGTAPDILPYARVKAGQLLGWTDELLFASEQTPTLEILERKG